MANMNFGMNQIGKETPMVIRRVKSGLNFLTGGIVVFIPQLATSLHTSVDNVTLVVGLVSLAINGLAIMFGVPQEEVNN